MIKLTVRKDVLDDWRHIAQMHVEVTTVHGQKEFDEFFRRVPRQLIYSWASSDSDPETYVIHHGCLGGCLGGAQ